MSLKAPLTISTTALNHGELRRNNSQLTNFYRKKTTFAKITQAKHQIRLKEPYLPLLNSAVCIRGQISFKKI